MQTLQLALALQEPGPGWTIERIRERFGGSCRTAERRLDAVRQIFPDLEGTLRGHQKFWRLPAGRAAGLLNWTADEIAALELARDRARKSRRADHAEALASVLEKVQSLLALPNAARLAPDVEALVESEGIAARPGPRPRIDAAHLTALRHAILACRSVRLGYRRREDGKFTRPLVHPYGFLHGHRHYLVAWNPKRSKLVLYALPNVTSVADAGESFERDPENDVHAFAAQSFGVYQEAPVDVVWRFKPGKPADDAREYVFHPTQQLEDRPDGSLLVRFRACGLREMAWHLFTWGDAVQVLEPPALKEAYRELVEQALRAVSEETRPGRMKRAGSERKHSKRQKS
ncbi:MAG: WYL domain-containing protein [Myxococcales bacterium]|nr:WYL domain-containing protein [Myxococcales bacterium]